MMRRLKAYLTSIGFFDLAVAAPSMKAALEIWGADSNLFHQGFAKEADDAAVVAATMEHPGVVLRRPVGTKGAFKESADLPKGLASGGAISSAKPPRSSGSKAAPKVDRIKAGKALKDVDTAQRKREAAEQKAEIALAKRRQRTAAEVAKAQSVLDTAEKEHDVKIAAMKAEREKIEQRAEAENRRWEKQREKLNAALKRAKSGNSTP